MAGTPNYTGAMSPGPGGAPYMSPNYSPGYDNQGIVSP
jgi:hypothetical protein